MAELHKSWSKDSLIFVLFVVFVTINVSDCKFSSLEELKAIVCGSANRNFDSTKLVKPMFWSLEYSNDTTKCLTTNGTDVSKVTGCKFKFSFCHAFNYSKTDTSLMNATACLATHVKDIDTQLKLGTYDSSVNPFEDKKEAGIERFFVHFIKGGNYTTKSNQSCTLSMDMEFTCNRKTLWKDAPAGELDSTVDPAFLTAISYDAEKCAYSLHFDYSGACAPEPKPSSSALSAGSVMLIIFFVCVTLYFVLGCLIKLMSGHRGVELIPNNEFWVSLPVYIADGCLFTCSCGKLNVNETSSKYDTI